VEEISLSFKVGIWDVVLQSRAKEVVRFVSYLRLIIESGFRFSSSSK